MQRVALFMLLFLVYVGLAAWVPPWEDEIYYWCWSQDLQWSYFDHPAMVAVLIRISTELFGNSILAIRLPACFAFTIIVAILARLIRYNMLLVAVVFTPIFTYGAILITPDTCLMLMWAIYLYWLVNLHEQLEKVKRIPWYQWLLGGSILGLGMLGKYTMALAAPSAFFSFICMGGSRYREWLWGYSIHCLVAACFTLPIFIFNMQHEFAPLRFQWEHATVQGGGWRSFGEFLGVQVLLVGTLPIVLFPWVLWNYRTFMMNTHYRVCFWLYALPFGFFLWKSVRGPLEGNWALASYLGFWPLAVQWFQSIAQRPILRWASIAAFLPPMLCILIGTTHLIHPLPYIPIANDRITRQPARFQLAVNLHDYLRGEEGIPIFAANYQWVALLRYQGLPAYHEPGITRPSNFTLQSQQMIQHDVVYYWAEVPLSREHTIGFLPAQLMATFPLSMRGQEIDTYKLWRYVKEMPMQKSE